MAEFHPNPGETWLRARCSRCHPVWSGPWRRISDLLPMLLNGRRPDVETVDTELREKAMADAFGHADRFHDGPLW